MTDDKLGCWASLALLAIGAALFLVDITLISPARCAARFPNLHTEFSLFAGCQVQTEHGLIPAENFRVM